MSWIDISMPLHNGMLVWPDDPRPEVDDVSTVAEDGVRISRLVLGSHSGTHIDAPAHFLQTGYGVDAIPLEVLMGRCRVLHICDAPFVRRRELEPFALTAGERILLRTRNGDLLRRPVFDPNFAALDLSAADYLVSCGVSLIGIDALSIEAFEANEYPVHKRLLSAGVAIVEGLDLADVPPGAYDLVALPLRLSGLDGSPARVALRPLQDGRFRSGGLSSTV